MVCWMGEGLCVGRMKGELEVGQGLVLVGSSLVRPKG
jgi:hypothetical protein